MKRVLGIVLGAALALAGFRAEAVAQPQDERVSRQTRAMCPALRDVDFRRLNMGWDAGMLAQARAMLRAGERPDLDGAEIVIRFHAPSGFGGAQSTWTTARRSGGEWRFVREDYPLTGAPPPPYDPYVIDMRARRPQSPIVVTEGALESERGARIDAALADPCLAREPDTAPAALPLRGGESDVCYDGALFFMQIERAEGVRTFAHVCETRWRAGEIMQMLDGARGAGGQVTVTNALTPLILIDAGGRDVPEADAPSPVRLTLTGDVAGREVSLSDGEGVRFQGRLIAQAGVVSWRVYPPLGAPAPTFELAFAGCAEPLRFTLPQTDTEISVHGCRLTLGS